MKMGLVFCQVFKMNGRKARVVFSTRVNSDYGDYAGAPGLFVGDKAILRYA